MNNLLASLPQQAAIEFLSRPQSYPDDPVRVEVRETHHSWVFLTDRWVYKLKKLMRFDSLDFSSLSQRERYCREELRLNRRLAPLIYKEVVALTRTAGGFELGGQGPVVDWLVKMVRLPADTMLPSLLTAGGRPPEAWAERVAALLRRFYASATRLPYSPGLYLAHFRAAVRSDSRELLRESLGPEREQVSQISQALLRFLRDRSACLAERGPKVVDAHGDLRPEHISLDTETAVIDCLEFCPGYRRLDPADELCLLWLECERLGAAEFGEKVLRLCLPECLPTPLLDFYRACHGLLRAKLAHWHAHAPGADPARWMRVSQEYLELARTHLP